MAVKYKLGARASKYKLGARAGGQAKDQGLGNTNTHRITLSENEKLIINDQKCAEVFNNYFNSIVEELNIPIDQNLLNDASLFDEPIIAAVHNYP